jgi:hypothetical protein
VFSSDLGSITVDTLFWDFSHQRGRVWAFSLAHTSCFVYATLANALPITSFRVVIGSYHWFTHGSITVDTLFWDFRHQRGRFCAYSLAHTSCFVYATLANDLPITSFRVFIGRYNCLSYCSLTVLSLFWDFSHQRGRVWAYSLANTSFFD